VKRLFPNTPFIGAQVYSRQRSPCWLLPLRKYLFLVLPFLYIHSLSFRPSSIHATVAPCLICPITTATIFTCRGYQRVIAVQKPCKTRSVCVPPFLFCHFGSDDISKVRGHAFHLISRPGSGSQQASSIASMMGSQHKLSDTRAGSPLRVNTDVSGALSANQREMSAEADARDNTSVLSPARRYASPISRVRCDGWCGHDLIPRATVVSVDSPASCG